MTDLGRPPMIALAVSSVGLTTSITAGKINDFLRHFKGEAATLERPVVDADGGLDLDGEAGADEDMEVDSALGGQGPRTRAQNQSGRLVLKYMNQLVSLAYDFERGGGCSCRSVIVARDDSSEEMTLLTARLRVRRLSVRVPQQRIANREQEVLIIDLADVAKVSGAHGYGSTEARRMAEAGSLLP